VSAAAVGISAGVSIGGAHAAWIHGVAFPLAPIAWDACLSRALALGDCSRHDWQKTMNFKACCFGHSTVVEMIFRPTISGMELMQSIVLRPA
jgi:hypothetical protein